MEFTTDYQNDFNFIKEGNPIPEIRQGELLLESTSFCLYFRDSTDFCFGLFLFEKISHSDFKYRSEVFKELDKICVANGKRNYKVYYTREILDIIETNLLYSRLLHPW